MLKPLDVFADSLVAGIVPAKAEPRLLPSIFTEPAVGVAPAPALLSAVGAPPACQQKATCLSPAV